MPNTAPKEVTNETIESPYRISWIRLGKIVIPLLLLVLTSALWFDYLYIPSKLKDQGQNIAIPDTSVSTTSANKNTPVELTTLLSNANRYSDKFICTTAFYHQASEIIVLMESFDEQKKELGKADIWVVNETGKNIVTTQKNTSSVRKIEVCGKFETGQKYGHLRAYKHQITLTSFTEKGETILIKE